MRGSVEGLGRARKTGAAAVELGMGPNCQFASIPLRAKTAVNLCMRGVMSILMSCCSNAMGVHVSKSRVAVPLGISHMMASCHDSENFAPRRMAR